jgi:hypothetical protein
VGFHGQFRGCRGRRGRFRNRIRWGGLWFVHGSDGFPKSFQGR